MSLLETIRAERAKARRDSKPEVSAFLAFVVSESEKVGKDSRPPRESTDEDVIGVIRKTIGTNEQNIALTKGEDKNAAWQNKLLNSLLPAQMSDEDVEREVKKMIEASLVPKDPKLIGVLMSSLKTQFPGQYNPRTASEIVRRLLTEEVN